MHTKKTVIEEFNGKRNEIEMVFGTGRLTNDPPELRQTTSGKNVLSGQKGQNFSIAFNQGKDKEALFYRLEAWDKTAENLQRLGFKGQEIELAARVKVENFTRADGTEGTANVLIVDRFDVKSYKEGSNGSSSNASGSTGSTPTPSSNAATATQTAPAATQVDADPFAGALPAGDDDIPF